MSILLLNGGRAVAGSGGTGVVPFFADDFGGTQRNPANGFTYGGTGSRVSVVSFDGYNALRFRYGPDAVGAGGITVEQPFALGRQLQELWLEYYLHIPSNLVLRSDPPNTDPNKLLALWPNNYSTVGEPHVVTEFWRNGSDSTSYARILGLGDLYPTQLIRGGDAFQNQDFINTARAGAWHRLRVHYKLSSGAGQTDGVYEGWLGNTLMWRSRSDWVFWYTGGVNFIANGYLMGASNPGYTNQTDYHIRSLKFYDTNPNWGMV